VESNAMGDARAELGLIFFSIFGYQRAQPGNSHAHKAQPVHRKIKTGLQEGDFKL